MSNPRDLEATRKNLIVFDDLMMDKQNHTFSIYIGNAPVTVEEDDFFVDGVLCKGRNA